MSDDTIRCLQVSIDGEAYGRDVTGISFWQGLPGGRVYMEGIGKRGNTIRSGFVFRDAEELDKVCRV